MSSSSPDVALYPKGPKRSVYWVRRSGHGERTTEYARISSPNNSDLNGKSVRGDGRTFDTSLRLQVLGEKSSAHNEIWPRKELL